METRLVTPRNANPRILREIQDAGLKRTPLFVKLPQCAPQTFDNIPVDYAGVRSRMYTGSHYLHEIKDMYGRGDREAIATPLYLNKDDNYIGFSFRGSASLDFMQREKDRGDMMFAKVIEPLRNSDLGRGYLVMTPRDIPGYLITEMELPAEITLVAKTQGLTSSRRGLPMYVLSLEEPDYSWQYIAEAQDSGDLISGKALGFDSPTRPHVLLLSSSTGFPNMFLPLSETSHYIAEDINSRVSYFLSLIEREIFGKVIAFDERKQVGTFSMRQAQDDLLVKFRANLEADKSFEVEITEAKHTDGKFRGWRVWADHLIKGYIPAGLLDMHRDFDPLSVVGRSVTVTMREIKPYNRYFDLIVKPVTDFSLYPESLAKDWAPPQQEEPAPSNIAEAFRKAQKD